MPDDIFLVNVIQMSTPASEMSSTKHIVNWLKKGKPGRAKPSNSTQKASDASRHMELVRKETSVWGVGCNKSLDLSPREKGTVKDEHRLIFHQKDDRRTENPAMWWKAERTGLFSLQKKRLRGDLITTFQYLKGMKKLDTFYTKSQGKDHLLFLERFRLDTRGKFFTGGKISHWNNLPGEAADPPTLDTLKIQLDKVLGHLV